MQRGLTAEVLQAPVTALGRRRGPSPTETRRGGLGRSRGRDSRQSHEAPSTSVRGAGPGKGDPAHPRALCGRAGPRGWTRDPPALPAPAGPPARPHRPQHRPGWAPGRPTPHRPPAEGGGSNTSDPCPLPEASAIRDPCPLPENSAVHTWPLPTPSPPSRTGLSPCSLRRGDTEAHGGPRGSNQTGCPCATSGHFAQRQGSEGGQGGPSHCREPDPA